jgi:hypothetical protein
LNTSSSSTSLKCNRSLSFSSIESKNEIFSFAKSAGYKRKKLDDMTNINTNNNKANNIKKIKTSK